MSEDKGASVTVLGMGPMGQALAGAFLAGGHRTTVWNRTAARADAVVERGAARANTVAEAVAASQLVIVCVIDYAAAMAILAPAADALGGRTVVNLTADTPERARKAAAWAAEHGIDYLDGAIMTPTTTIGGPSAVVIYSGPEAVYQAHRATLAGLGGTGSYLGAEPGRAAAHDVALLDIFWTSMSGLVHGFALAATENVRPSELAPFAQGIARLLPEIIDEFVNFTEAGAHPGDEANISSAEAGMAHIQDAALARGIDASLITAARGMARRAIEAGHGGDGFSRLIEVMRQPTPVR